METLTWLTGEHLVFRLQLGYRPMYHREDSRPVAALGSASCCSYFATSQRQARVVPSLSLESYGALPSRPAAGGELPAARVVAANNPDWFRDVPVVSGRAPLNSDQTKDLGARSPTWR
jgi:hypothetical protein